MSKIGTENLALTNDDMGEPDFYVKPPIFVIDETEEEIDPDYEAELENDNYENNGR